MDIERITGLIASLSWPHVSLIFAVLFVIIFNKPIREFIGRIKSVGKEGLTTESAPKAQNEEKRKRAVEELMKIGDFPLMLEVEKLIQNDLEQRGLKT